MSTDALMRPAAPRDLESVLRLLMAAGLTAEGVAEHFRTFWVAEAGGAIVGAVGLERYGRSALLRSLVVNSAHRGRGLGQALTRRALDEAAAGDHSDVYLLTESAEEFFPRFGFAPIDRERVPDEVRRSVQFQGACPETCAVMRSSLRPHEGTSSTFDRQCARRKVRSLGRAQEVTP